MDEITHMALSDCLQAQHLLWVIEMAFFEYSVFARRHVNSVDSVSHMILSDSLQP